MQHRNFPQVVLSPLSSKRPFYRSATFRVALVLGGLLSGWTCVFGPEQWRRTPSLLLIRSYGLPWWVWSAGFLLFAVMLAHPAPKWHVHGCRLGLVLYGIFFVSVLAAIRPDRPTNLVISSLALIGLVALYQAMKLATFDREGL